MEQHINFITLGVADLAVSRRFCGKVFGWRETEGSNESIAFFETGRGLLFALFGKNALAEDAQVPSESSGFPRFSLAHNVGSKDEVDTLFEGLIAAGAQEVKKPEKYFGAVTAVISPTPMGFCGKLRLIRF